jgi:hypothetical protein
VNGAKIEEKHNGVPSTMQVGATLYSCVRSLRGLLLATYTLLWLLLIA